GTAAAWFTDVDPGSIEGVEVVVQGDLSTGTGWATDLEAVLAIGGLAGTLSDDKATGAWTIPDTGDLRECVIYGGPADTWGLTGAQILAALKAGTLGFAWRGTGDGTSGDIQILHVTIRVYYTKALSCKPFRSATTGMAPFAFFTHQRKSGTGSR